MRVSTLWCLLATALVVTARSPQHVGKKLPNYFKSRGAPMARSLSEPKLEKRASPFATAKTQSVPSRILLFQLQTNLLQNLLSTEQDFLM